MSKNFFKSFLSTLLALMMILSVAVIPSSAASVKLSKTSIALTKGYSTTLSVSGTSSSVTWSTGNKNVATVSSKGKVVGKKVGSTYIYAKVGSTTLKCKVTVVAGKISVAKSSTELEPGDTEKIRIKAIGTHAISVNTSNKNVVKATWNGAKFSGDYIYLTLKAVNPGSARVKVYVKSYPSIYKYINVDVIGEEDDDTIVDDDTSNDSSTTSGKIQSSVSSVSVAEGASQSFTVYASSASVLSSLRISSSSIFGFAVKTSSDTSKNALVITVTGYSAETGTIKVYSTSDSKLSVSIPVTVTAASAQYYKLLTTKPSAKILQTDTIIGFQNGTTMYYMLVPYGYDPAYANSVAAKELKSFSYNIIYDTMPQKKLSNDQIILRNVVFNGTAQTRYVLAPYGYDSAFIDTIFAKYTGRFDYYIVYTEKPTSTVFTDEVLTWNITKSNAVTGKNEVSVRYMLVPMNYDTVKANEIKNKDMNTNVGALAYTVYDTLPTVDTTNYRVIQWTKDNSQNRYMVIPVSGCDYIKRNDIIRKDVGYFSYYVAYSERPTVASSDKEAIYMLTLQDTSGILRDVYILYNPNDTDYQAKINAAIGVNSAYIGIRQGSLA